MKQFYVFMINGIFCMIGELVDASFGNNLGIDSICVLSALFAIEGCLEKFFNWGSMSYQVKMSKESECLILSGIFGGMCALFLIGGSDCIPYLWSLIETQYELFKKCMVCFGAGVLAWSFNGFMHRFVVLNCMNRLMMTSDVLYYIVIIIVDTAILCLRLPCYWMIIATNIVLALQAVLFAVCSKVWRKLRKPSAKALKECFLCGRDLFFEKIFTTVMNILFNSLASRLGTELYALNSICSSITTYMNYVILSIYDFLLVRLKPIGSTLCKYKEMKVWRHKCAALVIGISYVLAYLMAMPMKGDVSTYSVLGILWIYCTKVFTEIIVQSHTAYAVSCGSTKHLVFGSIVGAVMGTVLSCIGVYTPVGIFAFALVGFFSSCVKGLLYRFVSKKIAAEG